MGRIGKKYPKRKTVIPKPSKVWNDSFLRGDGQAENKRGLPNVMVENQKRVYYNYINDTVTGMEEISHERRIESK